MKRLFLAGAITLFGLANAQVNFGIKAGYTHSTVQFKGDQDQPGYKSGFYVGGMAEYDLSEKLSLGGSLLYSNIGFKLKTTKENKIVLIDGQGENKKIIPLDDPYYRIKNDYRLVLNTLMVPLSLKYHFGKEFSVFGGINLGYTFSAVLKQKQKYNLNKGSLNKQNKDYSDMINKFSAAPFVGVAYNLSDDLFFEADYNYGITNIYDSSKGLEGYSRFLQIGLGYKF